MSRKLRPLYGLEAARRGYGRDCGMQKRSIERIRFQLRREVSNAKHSHSYYNRQIYTTRIAPAWYLEEWTANGCI